MRVIKGRSVVLLLAFVVPSLAIAETLPDVPRPFEEVWKDGVFNTDGCGDITYEGCCEYQYNIKWCMDGTLVGTHCGKLAPNASCGWNPERQIYDCGYIGTDPSGKHPYSCPEITCIPDCTNRACGSDGCGGSCGTCPPGEVCDWKGGTTESACTPAPGCGTTPAEGCCSGVAAYFCDGTMTKHQYCYRYKPPHNVCGWIAEESRCGCGGVPVAPAEIPTLYCAWVTFPLDSDSGPDATDQETANDISNGCATGHFNPGSGAVLFLLGTFFALALVRRITFR